MSGSPTLAPYLDADLQKFYLSLLRSEARHYQDYLALVTAGIRRGYQHAGALFR